MTTTATRMRLVHGKEAPDGGWGDPYETLVPEGEYTVALVSEDRCVLFGRPTWETVWVILDEGLHHQKLLYCWWRIPKKDERIRPSLALAEAYAIATERRPPRDLARRKPSSFLSDSQFAARVRPVTKNRHGVERPAAANYSRVACLVKRVAGTPPCLQRQSR